MARIPLETRDGKGQPNGYASLDGSGRVPAAQLPAATNLDPETVRDLTAPPDVHIPLVIPTYDGDVSVVHCDVIRIPQGWNGYRYWMGFTPYPGADRENPSVVASHDGVTWEVPAGLTNPITPTTEANGLGLDWNSDTDLVLLPDGVTMALYYRAYKDSSTWGEVIRRKTSTNGTTWSAAQTCFSLSGGTASNKAMSPTVVVEDDGTFTMWTVNRHQITDETHGIERRTSTDGITWSTSAVCTLPAGVAAWHVDVQKVAGIYHMLLDVLDNGSASRLVYLSSTDGVTWASPLGTAVPAGYRSVPLSGFTFDGGARHYRSSMLPVVGDPLRWDVYASGIPTSPRVGTLDTGNNPWRFGLFRNLDLTRPKLVPPAVGAAATDAASAVTLANNLRSALIAAGVVTA